MIFLLSSDHSPRYKQDILRCLAAPIGSAVQFRYDKVHIAEDTLSALISPGGTFPIEGIVCSVASNGIGVLPMVPVRKVFLMKPHEHGATLSIPLRMGELVLGDATNFTADLHRLANQNTPRRRQEGEDPTGFYCFSAESPKNVQTGRSLAIWENTVVNLREQHAYKDEPFFWVAIGIERDNKEPDTSTLHSWPDSLDPNVRYQFLIYHFQPRGGNRPNSKMEVSFGVGLQSVVPPDTKIDSRYDLKSWTFSTADNPRRRQITWLRVRTACTWDLDLRLGIKPSYLGWAVRSFLTGILVATPAILALIPQSIDAGEKWILAVFCIVAGILASVAATFRIEKPRTD